ncbi:tetratricopeptide repeat protein [Calditerrivibrio nitroreducens]|uniref:tetratricopeptide repeat protein n=1 Tax=Calditerrivibrio nitroreducens TaxID=477976 RepID=UPI003C7673AB
MIGFFGKKESSLKDIKELFIKGQIKKAISLCEDYTRKNPEDFDSKILLIEMYYTSGDKNKAISMILDVVKKLEDDKFYEKAAAVLRKGIKYYPDYYDFYKYLAKIFATKGLTADQIGILKELAASYEKIGEMDKFFSILQEIFSIDRYNYGFIKYVIDKLIFYKRDKDICKYLQVSIELARHNNDVKLLERLVELGISNRCIFGKTIKYTVSYFKNNPDKISIFIKESENYLLNEFDEELFKELTAILPYAENREFYNELFVKYTDSSLFEFLLPFFIKENVDKISIMFDKIKDIRDKNIDRKYAEIFNKYLDQLPVYRFYDNLLLLAKLTDHDELKCKIVSAAGKFADMVDVKQSSVLNLDLLENDLSKKDDKPVFDLLEHNSYKSDFSLDTPIEENEIKVEHKSISEKDDFDIELDLSEFEDKKGEGDISFDKDEKVAASKLDVVDMFEIDLTEHTDSLTVDKGNVDSRISDESFEDLSLDFFGDTHHKEPEDDVIKVDFSQQIKEIKECVQKGRYEYAKIKLEELILLDPENDELKDLAVKIYSVSSFDESELKDSPRPDIISFDNETKKVIKAIKDSIAKNVSPDDYEMHYDLAQAYMEMDLLEEAIDELKKSAYGDFRYKSLILMFECYKRLKKFNEAIDIVKLIILDFGKNNDVFKNSLYELGSIYELMGDYAAAKSHYAKLYSIDQNFRDVKDKMADTDFEAKRDKGDDSLPVEPKKKKKISFM